MRWPWELGLFASTVVDALKGDADSRPNHEGYEPDGIVSVDELVKFVDSEIPKQARQLAKSATNQQLTPVRIGNHISHFAISRNPAEFEKSRKRLDAFAALSRTGVLGRELANEGTMLLSRMPTLKAAQELRKKYQELADGTLKPEALLAARERFATERKLAPKDAEDYCRKLHDVTEILDEKYVRPVDKATLAAAAVKGMYTRLGEPVPAELVDTLNYPADLSEAQRESLLKEARLRLGKREDLDEDKDVDIAASSMMAAFNDPYSAYFNRETVRLNAAQLGGRFPGVGMNINSDLLGDRIVVVTPIKGSPAFEAGVRAGDVITEIRIEVDRNGSPLPAGAQRAFSTKGMSTGDAISLITGKAGTTVTLLINRDGKELVLPLKRTWVNVETVFGVQRNRDAEWDYLLDPGYKIGFIRLSQFVASTTGDLKVALETLKADGGLNGLVLDLRGNLGGFLNPAADICEMLLGKEKFVTIRPREGKSGTRSHRGERAGETGFEIVVLINGKSASSSEIVAGCLQDHERAIVVGERSYGKGSVQDVIPFPATGGEIKLTIARYFSPLGRNIDKLSTKGTPEEIWGVRPNKGFEVILSRSETTALENEMRELELIAGLEAVPKRVHEDKDRQLKTALAYLRETLDDAGLGPRK